MKKREVLTDYGNPIFGNDTEEIVDLRRLRAVVWQYIREEASLGDLIDAANQSEVSRRKKRKN